MNMINLLNRLAGLDKPKKSVITESINERGMSMNVDESVDTDTVMEILKNFERRINEIGGYGDIDVNKVISLLQAGDTQGAADEASYSFSDQDGGEVSGIEEYVNELEGKFEHLVSDSDDESGNDYTDWSMRQGEMGNYGEGQDEASELDEASIADIPADVLSKGVAEIEAGADCYDVLNRLNKETGREYSDQFKTLIRGAQNDAHMEYDTQGGDITPFLLDTMKGLVARGESMDLNSLSMESLRYLSGINKTITECGIPTAMVGGSHTPASINITASSGPELTGMLKDIMSLAGVRDTHKPIDVLASPSRVDHTPAQGPDMAALIRAVDEPEADSDSMNDDPENEGMPEKTENRPWDSSPHEKERQDGMRKFGDANSGDHRERQAGLPRAKPTTEAIAAQLFADYKKFVSEAASDEPAAPDADAIARRKRLQALKDKQEDDRAEKGSTSSGPRKVGGTSYGGSKSKDDADLDENQLDELSPRTLQNYAGKAKSQGNWAKGVAAHSSTPDREKAAYNKLAAKRQAGAAQAEKKAGGDVVDPRKSNPKGYF